jgi:hypothetical protein
MEDTEDVSRTQLQAMLYASPLIYGLVTAYVGLSFFDGIIQTVTLVMAAFGVVAVYVILKKLYENEYGIKL